MATASAATALALPPKSGGGEDGSANPDVVSALPRSLRNVPERVPDSTTLRHILHLTNDDAMVSAQAIAGCRAALICLREHDAEVSAAATTSPLDDLWLQHVSSDEQPDDMQVRYDGDDWPHVRLGPLPFSSFCFASPMPLPPWFFSADN